VTQRRRPFRARPFDHVARHFIRGGLRLLAVGLLAGQKDPATPLLAHDLFHRDSASRGFLFPRDEEIPAAFDDEQFQLRAFVEDPGDRLAEDGAVAEVTGAVREEPPFAVERRPPAPEPEIDGEEPGFGTHGPRILTGNRARRIVVNRAEQ